MIGKLKDLLPLLGGEWVVSFTTRDDPRKWFEAMKDELSKKAAAQFGSGWAWLAANKEGDLKISASPNQDNPLMEGEGYRPIVALDVWEHAYYLKYKNLRADYIKAFWEVLDWKVVTENYEKVIG